MKNENTIKKSELRKIKQERRKIRITKLMIPIIVVVAIVSIGVYFGLSMTGDDNNQNYKQNGETPVQSQNEIIIPLAEISNTVKFYTHESDRVIIRYFAVLGSDEEVHVAIDACDICYHEKKGYRQINDVMHCINCGREFPINNIGTENLAGGCWPSFVPIQVDGDDIILEISDLEAKRYMF